MQPRVSADNWQTTGEDPAPRFARWRKRLVAAERTTGWLDECIDAGRFLAVSRELVDALARTLCGLAGNGLVLEVCAGSGDLARHLAASGVRLRATDAEPPSGVFVRRMPAPAALRHFRPTVVLGAFVPIDSGVDEAVLGCPSVEHYVILNARIGGSLGSAVPWRTSGWEAAPLPVVSRWMLTRHDVWLGACHQAGGGEKTGDILQHGEAWHVRRTFDRLPIEHANRLEAPLHSPARFGGVWMAEQLSVWARSEGAGDLAPCIQPTGADNAATRIVG